MTRPDPLALAIFLMVAFVLAGMAQTAWFAAPVSRAFAVPLDGGGRFRGRRIFGANKTLRGVIVMAPAASLAFVLLAALMPAEARQRLWALSLPSYALLGLWAGLGFMAGELPNSFLKRQLDIPPGEAPAGRGATVIHFLLDRLDSGVGMLAAASLLVAIPWRTWVYVLTFGPFIHWAFSVLMFRIGVKGRAA